MTSPPTHERVSELLAAYLAGELDAGSAGEIDAHLETCDRCRAEAAGLRALGAPELAPLTDLERVKLRNAVEAEMRPAQREAPPRRSWAWTALGAAAALLILGVGLTRGFVTDGSEDAGSDGAVQEEPLNDEGRAGTFGTEDKDAGDQSVRSKPEAAALQLVGAPPFERDVELTGQNFETKATPLGSFAANYSAADAATYRPDFIAYLAEQAGGQGKVLKRCARSTVRRYDGMLPAYGALGTFEGRRAVVLGFARSLGDSERLTHFLLRALSRPGCNELAQRTGRLPR